MLNAGSDLAKGNTELCEVPRSVTLAYSLQRNEHQDPPFHINRYVFQQSDMDRSAYQPLHMDRDTHHLSDMAENDVHQFENTPSFDMTRNLNQSFDTPRGIQPHFEMARSCVQHQYDITRGATHPFEFHRSGNAPYNMARPPQGYEMGRGTYQYEMPRTQPYEVRPTHPQQVPQLYNYDKGYQECHQLQDTAPAKGDLTESLNDAQRSMEITLEMPKTAPQFTMRAKPGQKTSGHPFDFAKGYAQQLEIAKRAAQNAIQAKIKVQEEEKARQEAKLADKTKREEEVEKPISSVQPSEILKLYAQQLQMMKKAPKSSDEAKTSARQQLGVKIGDSRDHKRSKNQYSYSERLGRRKPSVLSHDDVRREEEHEGDNVIEGSNADDDGYTDGDNGDPPPFEMAKYMAQLSKTKCISKCQVGQDNGVAEGTIDLLTREEETSHSLAEATNPSGFSFSLELMKKLSLPLGADVKEVGRLRVKRDRQELTIANKAKLIEQVESRGAKKKADIAREWGLRPSTLSTIIKNKEKILTQFRSQRYAVGRRRMRTAAYPDVEEALLTWFRYARAAAIPITGPVLQGMGVTLAQELGHPEFSCSVGWLDRFKARHGLSFNPKNSQDSSASGTFNEAHTRILSPTPTPNEAVMDTNASLNALFPPAMPAVAPDVTLTENSSPSWFSNAMLNLDSTVEETEEQLEKWFPENMAVDEYDHLENAEDLASMWLSVTVPALLKDKRPKDIFSAGEAALFYNLLPDKSLVVKEEDGHKWTWVKERVTLLVAVNMDGSEKLPLLVIGQKPASETNSALDSAEALQLSYETNDSAMMTSSLFESWLRQLDQQYQASNRTISVIVENCPAHVSPKGLSNVELLFLPANTTPRLQPVEQGVIHTLKSLYRCSMLERMVDALETGRDCEMTFRKALELLQQSWKQVKTEHILKSFKQAGLQCAQNLSDVDTWQGGEDALALLERARRSGLNIPTEVTFESYLKVDSKVQTTVEEEAKLRVEGEDSEDSTPPGEALHALATLRKFIVEQGGSGSLLDTLADMESWVTKHIVKTEESIME